MPETAPVTRYDLVEGVDDRRCVECPERACDWLRQPDFAQERCAAPGVTGDRSSVADDEPKAPESLIFGHVGEQAACLVIGQRKERNLFVLVELDDDTRRPPAELSGAVVEQDRAKRPYWTRR
jgi:hypothetical protein